MKYERCEDCPECKKDFIKEFDGYINSSTNPAISSPWYDITPLRYCKLVMEDGKPKTLLDPRGLPPVPDWCPYKQDGEKA